MSIPHPALLGLLAATGLLLGCASPTAPPPGAARATTGVGAQIPALTLNDQFGVARSVDEQVEILLYTRDMDGGRIVRDALAGLAGDPLAAKRAVYVSDISRMPSFIAGSIAIPRMRDRAYRMLLDREGDATATLPFEAKHVTLLTLDGGTVTGVRFIASGPELREILVQ